jgi:HSP20 family molecular chaperone IbpA
MEKLAGIKKIISNRRFVFFALFIFGVLVGWRLHVLSEEFQVKFHFTRGAERIADNDGIGGNSGGSSGDSASGEDANEIDELDPLQQFFNLKLQGNLQRFEMSEGELKTRQDEKYIYYDLDFKGMTPQNLQVKVEEGQLWISGRIEMKSDPNGAKAMVSSSFQRILPIPPEVRAEKFELEQNNSTVTIKFPKIQSP